MNQNIDAQDGKAQNGIDVRSLQIYTRAEFRPRADEFAMDTLDQLANRLHSLCNASFASVLTDEAKQLVGMQ